MSKQTAAVGYVRVSRVGGRGGDSFLSPQLQREEIARAAAREGLRVVDVLEELDASGGDATRPFWNEAIRRVEDGEVGAVVVWNLSRFSRSVKDALAALDRIRAAGGRLVSAVESVESDPLGQLSTHMLLAIGQFERERAKAGFAAATASAVERGIHVAGTIPFGYVRGDDRRLYPDPDAAPIMRGIFERRAKGWSFVKLAIWAGDQGHEMSDMGVAHLVRNPVYTGQARYGATTKDDAHEALVSQALWRKCQGKRRPSARSGRLTQRYLLQGLCQCAACGSTRTLAAGAARARTTSAGASAAQTARTPRPTGSTPSC